MVNPTKRLAVIGKCEEECEGDLSYHWSLVPPLVADPKPNYVSFIVYLFNSGFEIDF